MDFKNPRTNIIIRVALLTLSLLLFASSIYSEGELPAAMFFLILSGIQVALLLRNLENRNQEVVEFLQSIEVNDFSHNYPTDLEDENLNRLNQEFNKVFEKLRKIGSEKEDDFQYMKNIVHHVGIGLITFDKKGNVQIINTAAKKLLKINNLNQVDELKSLSPALVDSFFRLRTGGRDLVRLEINGDIVQLAIYAIQLTLRGEEFKLVSLQNIQNELEEKEMEAWQNLVRVLTHEIMNSITPITSLANTIEESLPSYEEDQEVKIVKDDLEDITLAIQTIKRRGEGLMRFVQDFRNLTHIPNPKIEEINVGELVGEVTTLLRNEISDLDIKVRIDIEPPNMVIHADKGMITQVIINLVKNATQSFDEQTERNIEISALYGEKARPQISVKDNGSGIDEEALEKIFIPFFTTKKSGSGIGLSLSRQIMRKHQGILGVKTKVDEGTEFILKF